ncbi:MAG TPA: hypothetical protein ENJ91_10745 [Rhodobacteraceae bacterium]|nr:hypothetical protein [Paracoccaceae bacterium]
MGILFDMAAFYRWLENASDREMLARRDAARAAEREITDPELKEETKRLIRLIEEEIVARKLRV